MVLEMTRASGGVRSVISEPEIYPFSSTLAKLVVFVVCHAHAPESAETSLAARMKK